MEARLAAITVTLLLAALAAAYAVAFLIARAVALTDFEPLPIYGQAQTKI